MVEESYELVITTLEKARDIMIPEITIQPKKKKTSLARGTTKYKWLRNI